MANSPERYCWDSCIWIAGIQEEKTVEGGIDRVTRYRKVLELAKADKAEIVCSALCLAEVCKNPETQDNDGDKIAAFFEHNFILIVALDRKIGEKARELMLSGYPGLKPLDACHLATALLTPETNTLHTFDDRLLKLDGQLNKPSEVPLKICYPDVSEDTTIT